MRESPVNKLSFWKIEHPETLSTEDKSHGNKSSMCTNIERSNPIHNKYFPNHNLDNGILQIVGQLIN